jgi:hypothetical protein
MRRRANRPSGVRWVKSKNEIPRLRDRVGLTLAGDYTALVQGATESLGEDWAAGGVFRIYGNWVWPRITN